MVSDSRKWHIAVAASVVLTLAGCSSEQAALPDADPADPAVGDALMVVGPLGERALGEPNAPNVVIEYASLTCPHCRAFHTLVYPEFKEKYIDTGEVYFIYRPFSLNLLDTAAIMLTNCVSEDRFFPVVELLYDQQPAWAGAGDPVMALRQLVKQVGVTSEAFDACMANQEILDGVNWVKTRAQQEFGVGSTPTFFFNGEKRVGEHSLVMIDEILGS